MTRTIFLLIIAMGFNFLVAGCIPSDHSTIKIGVTSGPHAEIMDKVKEIAAQDGLKINIVEYQDYLKLNEALSRGEIDANLFQHRPYLERMIKERNYEFTAVAKTIIFPIGVYSKKLKNLTTIQLGATVLIPADPANCGRALILLEKNGLLKLKSVAGLPASIDDIESNPYNLKISQFDNIHLPAALESADLAVINANYAAAAGLSPVKDALAAEDATSPYVHVIVARTKDQNNQQLHKLVKAYQSNEIKKFITERYQGTILTAW